MDGIEDSGQPNAGVQIVWIGRGRVTWKGGLLERSTWGDRVGWNAYLKVRRSTSPVWVADRPCRIGPRPGN